MNNIGQLLQAIFGGGQGGGGQPDLFSFLQQLRDRLSGFQTQMQGFGDSMSNWGQQMGQHMQQMPRPDPSAMDTYREAMQGWRSQRPQMPGMPTAPQPPQAPTTPGSSAQPKGNAWGQRFQSQYGMQPGKNMDLFKQFKMGGQ